MRTNGNTVLYVVHHVQMGSLMGTMQPGSVPAKILCNISLTPRLDPVVHTPYLLRYYTATPPAAPAANHNGSGNGNGTGAPEPALLSFDALQARVTKRVAEGEHVRACTVPQACERASCWCCALSFPHFWAVLPPLIYLRTGTVYYCLR